MGRPTLVGALLLCAVASLPAEPAAASRLAVDVWTDRGSGSIYEPGDPLSVSARLSDDAYLMVYEIDSEGAVSLLYPLAGTSGFVPGPSTIAVPPVESKLDLIVQGRTGEGYLVAIASRSPFRELPWYLHPYDVNGQGAGYVGDAPAEEGVTSDGHIVGDPFVAMERVRRRVVDQPDDVNGFATSYTTYYVHEQVRYPRYLCNDCHRPEHYAWWTGFDPYYATCSVFDFRVNWGWYWGPGYWCGTVPYYVYSYRPDCPPGYLPTLPITYSSWNGWNTWKGIAGGTLQRTKPAARPQGYLSPVEAAGGASRGGGTRGGFTPPGFVTLEQMRGARQAQRMGRLQPVDMRPNADGVVGTRDVQRGGYTRQPIERTPLGQRGSMDRGAPFNRGGDAQGAPRNEPQRFDTPRSEPIRTQAPRNEPQRFDTPRSEPVRTQAPRSEPQRFDTPRSEPVRTQAPRNEPQRVDAPRNEPQRHDSPRVEPQRQAAPRNEPQRQAAPRDQPQRVESPRSTPAHAAAMRGGDGAPARSGGGPRGSGHHER